MILGCSPGGINADANPCNPENARVGAFSRIPFDDD